MKKNLFHPFVYKFCLVFLKIAKLISSDLVLGFLLRVKRQGEGDISRLKNLELI